MGQQPAAKIKLTDHAFFEKAEGSPSFRQALILDTEAALAPFQVSRRAERRLRAILELLDSLTAVLPDHWSQDAQLRQYLEDPAARRALLFAPREAAPVFRLSAQARKQLQSLAQMANVMAEVLFGAGIEP